MGRALREARLVGEGRGCVEGRFAEHRRLRAGHGRGVLLRRDLGRPQGRARDGRLQGRKLVGPQVHRACVREGTPRRALLQGGHTPTRRGVREQEARRIRAGAAVAVRSRHYGRRKVRRGERACRPDHGRERKLRLGRLFLDEVGRQDVPALSRFRRHPRRDRPCCDGARPHRGRVRAQQGEAARHRHVRRDRQLVRISRDCLRRGRDRGELGGEQAGEESEDRLREDRRQGVRSRRRDEGRRLQRRRQGREALGDTRFPSLRHGRYAEGREGRAYRPIRRPLRIPLHGGEGRRHGRAAVAQRAPRVHPLRDQLGLLAVERNVPDPRARAQACRVRREARHEHAQLPPLPRQRVDSQRGRRAWRHVLRGAGRAQLLPHEAQRQA